MDRKTLNTLRRANLETIGAAFFRRRIVCINGWRIRRIISRKGVGAGGDSHIKPASFWRKMKNNPPFDIQKYLQSFRCHELALSLLLFDANENKRSNIIYFRGDFSKRLKRFWWHSRRACDSRHTIQISTVTKYWSFTRTLVRPRFSEHGFKTVEYADKSHVLLNAHHGGRKIDFFDPDNHQQRWKWINQSMTLSLHKHICYPKQHQKQGFRGTIVVKTM